MVVTRIRVLVTFFRNTRDQRARNLTMHYYCAIAGHPNSRRSGLSVQSATVAAFQAAVSTQLFYART